MLPDFEEQPGASATFPLRGEGLRNWLNTSGSFLFSEFESGADALSFLRDNGVSIRTADFYSIRQTVLERNLLVAQAEPSLTVLADQYPDSLVPLGYTVSEHGYDLSQNFLYKFRIESINPLTGDVAYDYMAVGSDRQLTFNEASDLMGSLFTGQYVGNDYRVTDIAIDAAFVRPEYLT